MGSVSALVGLMIGIDSNIVIYAIEGQLDSPDPAMAAAVACAQKLIEMADNGDLKQITSELTLMEVLVGALKSNDRELADLYRYGLVPDGTVSIRPIDRPTLEAAADLRSVTSGLRTPDAIQIATSIRHGCAAFVTNDARLVNACGGALRGLHLGELQV